MESHLVDILHRYQLKATPMRLDVLRLLLEQANAVTHSDLSNELGEGREIDKVTLYRTLNAFTQKGILHRIPTEDRNWLYAVSPDLRSDTHPHEHLHAHFVCDDCDKVYCLPLDATPPPIDLLKPGFQVKTQEIVMHGSCPECHEQPR